MLLMPGWRFGIPIWQLPRSQWLPFACLASAYLASIVISILLRRPAGWRDMALLMLFIGAAFGLVFLSFLLARVDFSRTVTLAAFCVTIALVPLPHMLGAWRVLQGVALAGLLATTFAIPYALGISERSPYQSSELIRTEYYNLSVHTYARAVPKLLVHGGALARIGDRYLLVTGDGQFQLFGWQGADQLRVIPLPYRVPLNGAELSAFAKRPWATPYPGSDQSGETADGQPEVINTEWLRTHGLLVQEIDSLARIYVSYNYWHSDHKCFVERVSMLEGDRSKIFEGAADLEWRTLYETSPCLPVSGPQRRRGVPFAGYFGGGRMALLDPHTLLLTVGDFGFDGLASIQAHAQDPTSSYGKTIAIDITTGQSSIFTLGHRNPQGLHIDRSGTIWSTEHGPRGGDELNRLVRGKNYGWPYATDGTDYGSFTWPLNKSEEEQRGFQPPVFAWVPSIAISNLIAVEKDTFPKWRGDLLIATLNAKTLFRARIRGGQIAYLEAIPIGSGIRDIIEGHNGRIVLWTDDQTLISLRPARSTGGEALFAEKCSGCHQSSRLSGNRIGPNLFGVVDRPVAGLENYPDYSHGLRQLGGKWTEERLDEFLQSPSAMAPGTTMDVAGYNPADRAAIIQHLKTLGP